MVRTGHRPAPSDVSARGRWLVLGLVLAAGCDASDPLLVVRVRSDLTPGSEVARVRVSVREPAADERLVDVPEAAALREGHTVAELWVPTGRVALRVDLLDGDGAVVAGRPVLVDHAGPGVMTVTILRACRGDPCPAGQACHGGGCVDPRCTEETPEACGTPVCAADDDCPGAAACGTAGCRGGTCWAWGDDSRCGEDEICDPVLGCRSREACADEGCCEILGAPVDVLLVIDDSHSMEEEQASLAAELPRVVEVLATGDFDGDGVPEATAAHDLHFGVVTSDMGAGGYRLALCEGADDGILRTEGRPDSCDDSYPSFLEVVPSDPGADPSAVAADLACLGRAGTDGCGYEQPLEAGLKALSPSDGAVRFADGGGGHADGANAGFLREGSILVVLVLTDEDDCSAADPALFDPAGETYPGDLNLRCFEHPEALHPVERYVDGWLATRRDPRNFFFAVVAGIPSDLTADGSTTDFDGILADPRMEERRDPAAPSALQPSCEDVGGHALPPRRLVETARRLEARGATSVLGSICRPSLGAPLETLLRRITVRLGERCLI